MRKVMLYRISEETAAGFVDYPFNPMVPRELFAGVPSIEGSDGSPVFVAGIEVIAPGVGEIWIRYLKDPREWPAAWMAVKRLFDDVWERGPYHRLQSHVEAGSVSVGFNSHLGMQEEGVLRNYIDGKDFILMARVR